MYVSLVRLDRVVVAPPLIHCRAVYDVAARLDAHGRIRVISLAHSKELSVTRPPVDTADQVSRLDISHGEFAALSDITRYMRQASYSSILKRFTLSAFSSARAHANAFLIMRQTKKKAVAFPVRGTKGAETRGEIKAGPISRSEITARHARRRRRACRAGRRDNFFL
ncbi:hypothetical protein EVAR_2860_1 [Eumeta japonica]|uniref:Uncharacterized protein n=1 Tax=Eumeta variegata TaxID=151549 RepID=A0A4C1T0J5_EUMVA|nr:hypothetical protein EVAR_2860_1 [Eumeta japonica]